MLKRIKFNKIKKILKKLPKILGKRAFLTFLILFFLASIFGAFVFYKYTVLVKRLEPEVLEKPIQFNEKVYQGILNIWEEREKVFEEIEFKEYLNPFQKTTLNSE